MFKECQEAEHSPELKEKALKRAEQLGVKLTSEEKETVGKVLLKVNIYFPFLYSSTMTLGRFTGC